ncbi:MAG: 1,4-alpha-glucan-branching enzyme, partial [Bacteroidetes bacterium]
KYQYLGAFDKAMLKVLNKNQFMSSQFAQQLNMDEQNKTIVFERNNLIFVFNFHPFNSVPNYRFRVPKSGNYKVILNSDSKAFGGHGRIDESIIYPTLEQHDSGNHFLTIYNTNRTALVMSCE